MRNAYIHVKFRVQNCFSCACTIVLLVWNVHLFVFYVCLYKEISCTINNFLCTFLCFIVLIFFYKCTTSTFFILSTTVLYWQVALQADVEDTCVENNQVFHACLVHTAAGIWIQHIYLPTKSLKLHQMLNNLSIND